MRCTTAQSIAKGRRDIPCHTFVFLVTLLLAAYYGGSLDERDTADHLTEIAVREQINSDAAYNAAIKARASAEAAAAKARNYVNVALGAKATADASAASTAKVAATAEDVARQANAVADAAAFQVRACADATSASIKAEDDAAAAAKASADARAISAANIMGNVDPRNVRE
ncbi:membrane-associated protein, putative [Bodo saltans]|uniref:Membrane-associated protein, putative n=1 Tax=Bodo saltans TaxID=75058 RepID=A0A0S4JBY4_BODSA|nr:membrane-associated protein, putative [Bodo saltans]|eukprot:CUG86965.1 membrane-associated protein, putative [Bodo saltans]